MEKSDLSQFKPREARAFLKTSRRMRSICRASFLERCREICCARAREQDRYTSCRQAAPAQDLVIEAIEPGLPLGNQLRLEAVGAITLDGSKFLPSPLLARQFACKAGTMATVGVFIANRSYSSRTPVERC